MKLETPNCPECNRPAYGTVDTLTGIAVLSEPDEDGDAEYAGGTEISWDSQENVTDDDGKMKVTCDKYYTHTWFTKTDE